MLTHQVYFWLKSAVPAEARMQFEEALRELITIETIASATLGKPAATPDREVVDHSFDYSLTVQFNTIKDHDVYQTHAKHIDFVEEYQDLWASVKVYDAESFK